MYSNKLHEGGDFFVVAHFCSLLYLQPVWNNAGTQKDSINICWISEWNRYCLQSHLQRIKTLISIMLSLFKLFYGRNFSLGISFETTSIFFYSHTSIFGSNQYTLNEFTYVIYQAWIQITFSLYSQRVNLPSLRLLKERHRFWKQFSERHTKMFALIKLHWKKCLTSWDEYLEGNRTHLIYSCVFDKKSIPFLVFTLYSWKELKCFDWVKKKA